MALASAEIDNVKQLNQQPATADKGPDDDTFSASVLRLRSDYQQLRDRTNLYPPTGRTIQDHRDARDHIVIWYEDAVDGSKCVRIVDVPGASSGEILRLRENLPNIPGHFEIIGNAVKVLEKPLELPKEFEDELEDVNDLLVKLPLVETDKTRHFLKRPKHRSEIENLIKLHGGTIPGTPISPHIVRLLGRSADGQLVFPRLATPITVWSRGTSLQVHKKWLLDLIDGLEHLHSVGFVHRDLRLDNLLFSNDGETLFICDFEGHWGRRWAPEIVFDGGLDDSGWSPQSDIYDIGDCIKGMVYCNNPINPFVDWKVPHPLQDIVDACMAADPKDRPTLADLKNRVAQIVV